MERRRLYRSTTDRRLAGVCGGLAEYFDIDPLLVRIGFVIAALAGGPGIIAYVVLWIAMPKASTDASPPARLAPRSAAVTIAEERFARGEITAEELARIRADLAGG
jgi:phage shock protein C